MTPKQFIAFDDLCDRLTDLRQRLDGMQRESEQAAKDIIADAAKSGNAPVIKQQIQRLHDHMLAARASLSAEFMRETADVLQAIERQTHRARRRQLSTTTR